MNMYNVVGEYFSQRMAHFLQLLVHLINMFTTTSSYWLVLFIIASPNGIFSGDSAHGWWKILTHAPMKWQLCICPIVFCLCFHTIKAKNNSRAGP